MHKNETQHKLFHHRRLIKRVKKLHSCCGYISLEGTSCMKRRKLWHRFETET